MSKHLFRALSIMAVSFAASAAAHASFLPWPPPTEPQICECEASLGASSIGVSYGGSGNDSGQFHGTILCDDSGDCGCNVCVEGFVNNRTFNFRAISNVPAPFGLSTQCDSETVVDLHPDFGTTFNTTIYTYELFIKVTYGPCGSPLGYHADYRSVVFP